MAVAIDLLNSDPRKKEGAARHPEKVHRPDQAVMRKPDFAVRRHGRYLS